MSLLTASISKKKEWDRLSETKSSIAFCPTSNLYLGSGLFNLKKAWQKKVKVGMGTDIGAGTTFNMLQTLNEAYKVLQLQGYRLSAYEAFLPGNARRSEISGP